ncbi:MAG TPA: hypothetical protein VM286_06030 [Candidatus Thermoplasmatota archaeon]|nr:hypothetical protein [Candidatus Thermoplasmatota archaeon]
MRRLRLQLGPGARTAFGVLNFLPIPGVGAMLAGWRNPHSRLLPRGAAQALLVVFGTYPLIVPGAVGLAWAILDGVRILQADLVPLPPKDAAQAIVTAK